MKKKVLILNASPSEVPLILEGKNRGFYVIVTGLNENNVGIKFADKYIKADYSSCEQILEIAKNNKVDYVCSCAHDFGTIVASYVCEKLSLPGHDSFEKTKILHYKDEFKKFCRENNIISPISHDFSSEEEAIKHIHHIEFPVIVKPNDLAAGVGVTKAENIIEGISAIKLAFEKSRKKTIVIEPFIEGIQHNISAFIINEKVIAYTYGNEYSWINPYMVETDTFPGTNFEIVKNKLINEIEKICEKLHLVDGLFHVQYIQKDGVPYIIEVMRRCLGNLFFTPASRSFSFDWIKYAFDAECGLPYGTINMPSNNPKCCAYHCLLSEKNGVFTGFYIDDSIKKYIFESQRWIDDGATINNYLNEKIGILFFEFPDKKTMDKFMLNIHRYVYPIY